MISVAKLLLFVLLFLHPRFRCINNIIIVPQVSISAGPGPTDLVENLLQTRKLPLVASKFRVVSGR